MRVSGGHLDRSRPVRLLVKDMVGGGSCCNGGKPGLGRSRGSSDLLRVAEGG
jgi:hypothetical protein